MDFNKGDSVTIVEHTTKYNTCRKIYTKISGFFIRDYGSYIQIYDKFNIRRSISKQDIVKIERLK